MLTILGKQQDGFCDGLSRRSFLRIGGLAMGGLTLPQLLRAEAASAAGWDPHKAVIMIFLPGGPPHQDMWDLKPDAPAEVRGEFNPIASNVPGMDMCELFPKQAKIADKFAVVRGIRFVEPDHQFAEICTGLPVKAKRPAFGALVSRFYGGGNPLMPRFVTLPDM